MNAVVAATGPAVPGGASRGRTDWVTRVAAWPASLWLAVLALWLVATAIWRPLMLPDEGRYVGVAWEMLSSGDWLTPTLNGLPYFHKPPLMYWITAGAMWLFGPHALAMRAAPLVGAWLMGLALWLWIAGPGALTARRREAVVALVVLATMPFFHLGGQFANHDMLVAGCLSMSIVAARRALAGGSSTRWRWLVLAWGMAALAMLAKGLIGIVIPVLVLAPWLLVQRRWRELLSLLHPAGLLVFVVIGGAWFMAMEAAHDGFFDYFVIEQHFRRFSQSAFNNQEPIWFYLAALPLLSLPASLWLPSALLRARSTCVRLGLRAESAFALWWMVVVLGFFSLPHSKLVGYVLPALPPLAWLLAAVLRMLEPRRLALLVASAGVLCVAAVAGIAWKGPRDHADLGAALARTWSAGDRLAYIGEPFFDLRLQARLSAVPAVIEDWKSAQIAHEDTWRKELKDAGRFDPARAAQVLWPTDEAWRHRCEGGRLWLVLPVGAALPKGFADARLVATGRRGELRRVDGPAPGLACD